MDDDRASIRVATWNLERRGTPDRIEMIESSALDLLVAQEVTESAYESIVGTGLFGWSSFSLHFRPRSVRNSRSERLGVAIFGRPSIKLRSSGILPWLARPEKLVHADVLIPGWHEPVTVASYHASPGDGKPECTLQVAHWLELTFGPAILGLDANSPDVDHPDHERSVFHWQQAPYSHCEPALIGPPTARRHRLDDALRLWLAEHPEELAAVVARSPNGPLAFTYDRGSGGRSKPSRFDSIWVSPEFRVEGIEHRWDEAGGVPFGGSDHAMVVVELRHPPTKPRLPRQRVIDHIVENGLLDAGERLHLAVELFRRDADRSQLAAWLSGKPDRGTATFTGDRARPLEWDGGAGSFSLSGLVAHICAEAKVEFPGTPPGPHWWRDQQGRNLVTISDGGR